MPEDVILTNSFRFGGPGLEGWLDELDVSAGRDSWSAPPRSIYDAFVHCCGWPAIVQPTGS